MDKSLKEIRDLLGPLRAYWRALNRQGREAAAEERARHKVRDQRRPRCRCEAYPWPHRPSGGLCRHPDPPTERWQPKPGSRLYAKRYTGLRRQIARANGLHPIKDRKKIDALMPQKLALAKKLKFQSPKIKYRNMEITEKGIIGRWTTAGPTM
jgi:hypothetical protein